MKIKLLLLSVIFCLPVFLKADNEKLSKNTWTGKASYYHNKFEGRKTANGEVFRQKKMTAANNFLPLGTWVRVTNMFNGKSVILKINDRMAKHMATRRLIDMSRGAAQELGYVNAGLAEVKMEVIPEPRDEDDNA